MVEFTVNEIDTNILDQMFGKHNYTLMRDGRKVWTLRNRDPKTIPLLLEILNREVNRK